MGQKVSPHGLRVGINKEWGSKWYADKKSFADFLAEDKAIREHVKTKLYGAGVSKILIERSAEDKVKVIIAVGRSGMVIGKGGDGHEAIKKSLAKLTGKEVAVDIRQVGRTELDAQLTAERIAEDLEKRVSYRRAMKQAMGRAMKAGAKGIKLLVSGRLGGAEIARDEKYSEGNVPLHTLRSDIDYGFAEADTTYGKLGVKIWINHGEILDKGLQDLIREEKKDGRKPTGKRRNDRRRQRNRREDDSKRNKPLYMRKRPKAVKPEPAEPEKGNEAAVEAAPAPTEVSEAPNTSAENNTSEE